MRQLLLLLSLFIGITAVAQNKSNKGKEFWVGYGHNQLMGTNSQTMVLYLSAEQAATVTISVNGTTFSQTYNIPANTVIQTVEIPKAGTNDARIRTEGLSNKGVHIVSDVPIVAYAHQYGSNSSAATMLMPVETYGYTYYSLNYTQLSNSNNDAYSWFFVIASQDNTVVEITPSVTTQGGRPANVPFTVNLNKGEIYNVFGQIISSSASSTTGRDLTGSKIVSKANLSGECYPVAVFSGASRMVLCGNSGGDILQQQIFPASAWGTKYLTAPTIVSGNVNQFNTNFYRVAVRDPSTVVKRNGVTLTGLLNNFYYEFSSNQPEFIESDKPILVSQYMPSISGCAGYTGDGDPEMFFLSPIEQAIKKVGFYSTFNQNITRNYISIIIPSAGLNSLKIDGVASYDRLLLHPRNFAYRIAIKELSQGQHFIECDSAFTAITYGMSQFESYAYNAGTQINNLDNQGIIQNTYNTTTASNAFTCKRTPFRPIIRLGYKPTQLIWQFGMVAGITPNTSVTTTTPVAFDSTVINGRKYYSYRPPTDYQFNDTGNFRIPVVATSPDIDNCNNTETFYVDVRVNPGPSGDFTWTHTGCRTDTVFFSGAATANGFNITKYKWTFPDLSTDSVQNPVKILPNQGANSVKLEVIADNGCVGDTTKIVTVSPSPVTNFGMTPPSSCGPTTVTFTDTSSYGGGPIQTWYWDFGNGNVVTVNSNANQTQNYTAVGAYTVKHFVQAGSCKSDTITRIFNIYATPVAAFTSTQGCLQDSTVQFTNGSSVSDGQALTYAWNFGDPNATAGNPNTSTVANPTHKYSAYGTYPVTLTVTTPAGCTANITIPYTVVGFGAGINYTVANENSLCAANSVNLTSQLNVIADSVYRVDIYWDFGNNPTIFETDNSPTVGEIYSHNYPVFTTPANKSFDVKWKVYAKGGCTSEKVKANVLNAVPAINYPNLPGVCVNASALSIATATVTNGLTGTGVYSGPGTDAAGNFNPATAGVGQHTIKYVFTANGGCKDSVTQTIRVFPRPVANFGVSADICVGDSIRFSDSSTIASGNIVSWNWNFADASTATYTNNSPFFHTYLVSGGLNPQLTVTSDSGCVSLVKTQTVNISLAPSSGFTISALRCADSTITFTSTASTSGVPIQQWYWDFGNGQVVTAANNNPQTINYTAAGPITIKHMALATASCKSDTTVQTITIYANPVAAFDFNTGCLVDSLVNFTNNTTVSDAQTLSYTWNFGDANTSTQTAPSHQYAAYGTYPVTLTASTANGCVSTLTKSYRVAGFKPNVAFTVANETALCAASPISITQQTALAQDSVYRVDIFWDALNQATVFETDNAPTVAEIYQHAYAAFTAPATKNVTIKWLVYSKGGCITEYNKVITLHASPVLSYPTLTGICVNAASKSVATATASNGVTGTGVYSGPGTDATGNFNPATAGVGVHTIKYVFTTSGGCKDSITQTIRVFAKPSASFTLSGSVCLQDSVQLNNTSTIAAGIIVSWNWIFGDGNTANYSNSNSFYHTYNNFGNFIAQLTVVSDSACVSDTAFRPVVIHPLPVVDFTIPAFVCMPAGNAAFTNTSTINGGTMSNLNFAWDFGDGNTSVQISPTHSYAAVGTYNVRLVATSQQGCVADTVKQLSSFFPQPDAKFGISAPELCEGVASVFSDSSTAPLSAVASYAWDFGNGTTSTQPNPTVTYATPGNYTVRLTVTNTQGCTSDIETATVKVNLQPVVDAGLEKTVSQFSSIQLSPTVNSTTLNFAWTPAATLNNPNSLNPTATPLDNTWYKLTATGDGGCFATDSVLIKVLIAITIPNAFSPNNDGINDVWNVKGLSNYGNARIEIFARNGQLVYKSTGYNIPWDGKRNGQPLPAGVYYYIIEPNDRGYGKLTGFVTIVR